MQLRTGMMVAAALALGGCDLAEVTVPPSDDRLVVEAVMRTDFLRQTVLLHRTVQDRTSREETGAEVVVTGPNGLRVVFSQTTDACFVVNSGYDQAEVQVEGTCYESPASAGRWVQPGQSYELTVRTARGEEARARTTAPAEFTVPGIRTVNRADLREPTCTLPAQTPLTLTWTASAGAWGYLVPMNIYGLSNVFPPGYAPSDPLELLGLAVSAADTTILLPSEFGVFDRFDLNQDLLRALQAGLPERTSARVVIAAADRNYINGVRGGNFNPSGQVRISSIVGDGVGVFGSLTALRFNIDSRRATSTLPTCIQTPP